MNGLIVLIIFKRGLYQMVIPRNCPLIESITMAIMSHQIVDGRLQKNRLITEEVIKGGLNNVKKTERI